MLWRQNHRFLNPGWTWYWILSSLGKAILVLYIYVYFVCDFNDFNGFILLIYCLLLGLLLIDVLYVLTTLLLLVLSLLFYFCSIIMIILLFGDGFIKSIYLFISYIQTKQKKQTKKNNDEPDVAFKHIVMFMFIPTPCFTV